MTYHHKNEWAYERLDNYLEKKFKNMTGEPIDFSGYLQKNSKLNKKQALQICREWAGHVATANKMNKSAY